MSSKRDPFVLINKKTVVLPQHVAIIMDGNGRWAERQGLPRINGHQAGTKNIRNVAGYIAKKGIPFLTLYAFSTENWNRPGGEVRGLMKLLGEVIEGELLGLHRDGVRLSHLGRLERLSPDLQNAILEAVSFTQNNSGLRLNVAFDYGGRDEILQALKKIIMDGVSHFDLDDSLFSSYLYTKGIPDPDLIIRTAGEMRLSNFLIWQAAYSEYYSASVLWPDFNESEIDKALRSYSRRRRRFGAITADSLG